MTEEQSNPRAPCCRAPDNDDLKNNCLPFDPFLSTTQCSIEEYKDLAKKLRGYKISFGNLVPNSGARNYIRETGSFSPRLNFWSTSNMFGRSYPSLGGPLWNVEPCEETSCGGGRSFYQCDIYDDLDDFIFDTYVGNYNYYINDLTIKLGTSILDRISNKEFFIPYNNKFDYFSGFWRKLNCPQFEASKSFKISEPIIIRYLAPGSFDDDCEACLSFGGIRTGSVFSRCEWVEKTKILELKLYPILQISITYPRFTLSEYRFLGSLLNIHMRIVGYHKIEGDLSSLWTNYPVPFGCCLVNYDMLRQFGSYNFNEPIVVCDEVQICPSDEVPTKMLNLNLQVIKLMDNDSFRPLFSSVPVGHTAGYNANNLGRSVGLTKKLNQCLSIYSKDLEFYDYIYNQINESGYLLRYRIYSDSGRPIETYGLFKECHRFIADMGIDPCSPNCRGRIFGTGQLQNSGILEDAITAELVLRD